LNRQPRLLPIWLGVLLSIAGGLGLFWARPAEKTLVLGDGCRTPVRVLGAAAGPVPVAVVFHGFGASAAIMEPLGESLAESGWRVYLPDLAGHGRSREPFSYARVDRCAAAAVEFLVRSGRIVPARTVFIGHSLGAAVVIRLARTLPVAATVAISPALVVPPKRTPPNLLILAGQFDLGPVKQTARQLLGDAGGAREGPEDFARGRAVALRILSGELHGTIVLDPRTWKDVLGWAHRAVASGTPPSAASAPGSHPIGRPLAALLSNFALLAGMALLVVPALAALARLFRLDSAGAKETEAPLAWKRVLGFWAVAAFFGVTVAGLTRISQFVRPVQLEDGDWVALVALLTGLLLLILLGKSIGKELSANPGWLNFAIIAGLVLVALFSWAMRPELVESTLAGARLWRWAGLAGFTAPYFWAEEAALGPPGRKNRFLVFLAMRGLLFLAQVFAVLIFWPRGLLIVLLVIGLGIISIGQRLLADALRRRGAGAPAAAVLDAILAAGTLALVLPLI